MIVVASCGHNCDDERIYYKQINSLCNAGYKIKYYAYCYDSYLTDGYNDDIDYRFFSSSEISQKQYKTLLFNTLNATPPKIFHIHDMELLSVAYKLKQKHPAIKIIYDVHEDLEAMWDTFSSYSGIIKKIINWMLSQYEKQYLSCVDIFILANRLARKNKYIKYGAIHVLENFPLLANTQKHKSIDKPTKLIYHGQLSDERGIQNLIVGFNELSKTYPELELTLLGSPRNAKFESKLNELISNNKKIKYTGQIRHHEVWGYLKNAHIGIIPFHEISLCQYNTPTKLFEYMASNCAIVSSDLLPIREFLNDTITWTKPNDTESLKQGVIHYLNNIDIYNIHIKKNNQLIQDSYNWEDHSKILLSIYKELSH